MKVFEKTRQFFFSVDMHLLLFCNCQFAMFFLMLIVNLRNNASFDERKNCWPVCVVIGARESFLSFMSKHDCFLLNGCLLRNFRLFYRFVTLVPLLFFISLCYMHILSKLNTRQLERNI